LQVGDVKLEYDLGKCLETNGLDSCYEHIKPVPYDHCLSILKKSDILLVIQPNTLNQIPSKLYEYIYLNKPILAIAHLESALAKIISNYGFGRVFDPQDSIGIAEYLIDEYKKSREPESNRFVYDNRSLFDIKLISQHLGDVLRGLK
jgi:hypothetical protein